jgi:hypothetical protein
MSRLKSFGVAVCAVLLFASSQLPGSVYAALHTADDAGFGGGSLKRDTTNGLQWLGLRLSAGNRFTDMVAVDGSNEFAAGIILCDGASLVTTHASTAKTYMTPALEDEIRLCLGELEK